MRADTPAAIVYKATWPDEKRVVCTVATLAEAAEQENIKNSSDYRRGCDCPGGIRALTFICARIH